MMDQAEARKNTTLPLLAADGREPNGSNMIATLETPSGSATVVRAFWSDSEISDCRETWESLQKHPNADWQFYHLINRSRNEVENPCVLQLRKGREVVSLWAGRFERARHTLRLGYLRFGSIGVRTLTIVTGGIMGDDSEDACKLLLERALQVLSERRLDILVLSYVPTDHVLFTLATTVPKWYCRDWGVTPTIHWKMTLPASFEEFLKKRSKKHRYWLNRLPRVLEETFPGQVRIRLFKDPSNVDAFCQDAENVSKMTYQHQLGEAFRADAEYKTRCGLLATKGELRGYILYIADQPKAYWMATICRSTVYLNLTGYCPEFKKFELGTVLLMKLFEDHCGTAVQNVDFGHGGAMYKERFGDESFLEASVRIYRPGLRGVLANLLTGANAKISTTTKNILSKLGLLQRVKTLWRARMAG